MKFAFNRNGIPLQYFTGSLGWTFNVGDNASTTIRGFQDGGNLQNCPNDGLTLCTWAGVTNLAADYYVIHELELGNEDGLAPFYNPIEFQAIIGLLTL
ncbi:hypothetical protein Glove_79g87 [Diversispora epigaea]|uniref:Uncharacterized protein n=1 Tax=Diversispora epigaea TaxID=1348612 RepID=A0A397J8C0_9GLOM|nr:hypothetical protein Glove_79g87 [Diversispora epigaea]